MPYGGVPKRPIERLLELAQDRYDFIKDIRDDSGVVQNECLFWQGFIELLKEASDGDDSLVLHSWA